MRKRIIRSLTATVLITSIMGMTVLADEVTDIKNQQNSLAQEKQNVEDELAFLLTQMDELELSMAQKNDEIEQANKDLASAQQKFNSQQDDMKLRIKYMYEDQSTSLSEVFLSSKNMSEVLNKAEYVQQVYDYDRSKLDEMSNTAKSISNLMVSLENDKKSLENMASELTSKQALLYTTLDDLNSKDADLSSKLKDAQQRAAAAVAAKAAQAATTASSNVTAPTTANNDSALASNVVSLHIHFLEFHMCQAVQVLQVLTVQDLRHIFTDSMVYLCQDHHLHRHMVVNQFHLQVHSRVILYVIRTCCIIYWWWTDYSCSLSG